MKEANETKGGVVMDTRGRGGGNSTPNQGRPTRA